MSAVQPNETGTGWIDELADEQCMEIFWLYVEPAEPFLKRYPPELLGRAMRYALRQVAEGGRQGSAAEQDASTG